MKALILAAGYGTRLYPLTKNLPKPLLAVGKKPIIERIVDKLLEVKEIQTAYIVTNRRFAENFNDWLKKYRCVPKIEVIDDGTTSNEDRLGAVGDINYVLNTKKINDDLLVIAGDNLIDFNLNDLVKFFRQKGSCIALKDMPGTDPDAISRYSIVKLDAKNKIVEFEEKPPHPQTTLISIGLYMFKKNHLKMIKTYLEGENNPDAPGYYVQWLYKMIDLYGYVISGFWYDIGDIDSYTKACNLFEET